MTRKEERTKNYKIWVEKLIQEIAEREELEIIAEFIEAHNVQTLKTEERNYIYILSIGESAGDYIEHVRKDIKSAWQKEGEK